MNMRFAVVSDLHIALPETIYDHANRFHLVEVSIPVLEEVLAHLETLPLDFILLPGDLTQNGERKNHLWLQKRLTSLPFPAYVIPGNHDVPYFNSTSEEIGEAATPVIAFQEFPSFYPQFGYTNSEQMYYSCEVYPGVQLIGLNSNQFNEEGKQLGYLDKTQLMWLENTLSNLKNKFVIVMVHHNVIDHLPGQSTHVLGRRYMLDNAPVLIDILEKYNVKLIFTGHLHIQDISHIKGIYEITTGSLVSYPHPYRILELTTNSLGETKLKIESHRVEKVPGWERLSHTSKQWLSDRSFPFLMKLLTTPPFNLEEKKAAELAPELKDFWATMSEGDAIFNYPHLGAEINKSFQLFSAINSQGEAQLIDNNTILKLS